MSRTAIFAPVALGALLVSSVLQGNVFGAEDEHSPAVIAAGELGCWVNPFVGTGGIAYVCGMDSPAAAVPWGTVRLCPDTAARLPATKTTSTSGYYWGDTGILGFSHTRLIGTGAVDGGQFRVIPTLDSRTSEVRTKGQLARFTHSDEVAFPGYYAVTLSELGIRCELSATEHVGVHRYTFSQADAPHLLLDITSVLGKGRSGEGEVRILPEAREVEGAARVWGSFSGRSGGIKAYFVARLSRPLASFGIYTPDKFTAAATAMQGDKLGVDLGFQDHEQPVELRLAISYVSIANARENVEAEVGQDSFEATYAKARDAWERRLSVVRLEGGTEDQKKIFYTALWHALQMPTIFTDVNGDYLGFDKQVHRAVGFRYYTDLSLWDTFRTVHPLFNLIAPHEQRDMLVSLVTMAEQGGWLPRWPSAAGYTNSMLGTPADIVVAESYLKGIRDFDVETAYQAMKKTALAPTPKDAPFSGREGIEHDLKYGYCPADLMKASVARTLEFAYADAALARLAHALGHEEDAQRFAEHAQFYRHLWNPETHYFQPRDSQGKFQPIQPTLLTYLDFTHTYTSAYVEGSALQWRWAVPFDAAGLIGLFRDRDYFVQELNDFFARSDPTMGAANPGGYYWHGNEPDLYAAYLFNAAGRPDLTQKWVRWILQHKYGTEANGLDGNDDAGTLSAWYVLSALGIYPTAGTDVYQLGAPLFARAEVQLGEHRLTIVADNYAPENGYVQKVWLNDVPLDRPWLTHAEIAQGGVLRFAMAAEPPDGSAHL